MARVTFTLIFIHVSDLKLVACGSPLGLINVRGVCCFASFHRVCCVSFIVNFSRRVSRSYVYIHGVCFLWLYVALDFLASAAVAVCPSYFIFCNVS